MSRHEQIQTVLDEGLVAILRADSGEQLADVCDALLAGGIRVIEVTFTVPKALKIIETVRDRVGDRIVLGAGTVLDPETGRAALLAGAEFIVSPVVNTSLIELCLRYDKLVMPGAFTPTEVLTAWQAGADIVKVFPAEVGGPSYLKSLHGPLPQVRLLPTGGVNLQTLPEFIKAGACAVGLGSALVTKKDLAAGNLEAIRDAAAQYVTALKQARQDS